MAYTSRNPRFDSEYWTDQQSTSMTSPPSGAMRFFTRFGQIFRRTSAGAETMVSYASPNYVINPNAFAGAATGLTIAASGFSVSRGTTQATFSSSYFAVTGNTTINKTVDWTLNTLNAKDNSQLMDFTVNAKVVLNGGSTGVYKVGVWDGSAYVTGTTFNLSATVNEFLGIFTLNTSNTYRVRLEATTAGDAADVIYIDSINISPASYMRASTFTPTLTTTATQFSGVTYASQVGTYNLSGNMVSYYVHLAWTNTTGSPSGGLQISGLPFTSASTSNVTPLGTTFLGNVDLPAGGLWVSAFVSPSTTVIALQTTTDNGGNQTITASANGGATSRSIDVSGFYYI